MPINLEHFFFMYLFYVCYVEKPVIDGETLSCLGFSSQLNIPTITVTGKHTKMLEFWDINKRMQVGLRLVPDINMGMGFRNNLNVGKTTSPPSNRIACKKKIQFTAKLKKKSYSWSKLAKDSVSAHTKAWTVIL